jgi:hypothetical protein
VERGNLSSAMQFFGGRKLIVWVTEKLSKVDYNTPVRTIFSAIQYVIIQLAETGAFHGEVFKCLVVGYAVVIAFRKES